MMPPCDRVQDGRHLFEQEAPLAPVVRLSLGVNMTSFHWQMRALLDRGALVPFPRGRLIPLGVVLPERLERRA